MKMHDDQFDRLLRRSARAREDGRAPGECLDPETLAAWTDGTLSASQRSAAEVHAAACDRCLAMLAAMARTVPPPSAPQSSPWTLLRWAAPLATAAVAITAWVVIQQKPSDRLAEQPQPTPTVAEAQKPADSPGPAEATPSAKTRIDAIEKKESPQTAARKSERFEAPAAAAEKSPAERQRTAQAPAPASPPADPRADLRALASAPRSAAQPPVIISSQDPNIRWRISNRRIERSTDAGGTWTVQRAEAEGDLLAGTAPDADVCWIVGRMGIVLLTTDGVTWRRVAFPDPTASLVRVVAASSLDATVSTSDGRTYRTTDGGQTWTLQENSGPAF